MVTGAIAVDGCYRGRGSSGFEANRGVAWITTASRHYALVPTAGAAVLEQAGMQHVVAGSTMVLSTGLVTARCRRHQQRCGKHRSGLLRSAVRDTGQKSTATRDGFQVNDKVTWARSYGRVDTDDFEEAARVRSMFTGELRSQETSAAQRKAEARKRMLRRRLRRGNIGQKVAEVAAQRPAVVTTLQQEPVTDASAVNGGARGQEAGTVEGAGCEEIEDESQKVTDLGDDDVVAVGEEQDGKERSSGNDIGSAIFPGLADVAVASQTEGASFRLDNASAPTFPLSSARRLVADEAARRRCPGRQLAAAASALSVAGQHDDAAVLLRYLRDFGVEQDIIQRRLSLLEADALFQEAAVRLGLELQLAGQLYAAWEALSAACAEEQLSGAQTATIALTNVAMRLSAKLVDNPSRQVEVLQAAVDAAWLNRSLKRDRQDELELTLALSQQAAGDVEASKESLQRLQYAASSERRREQATWALMVQSVDTSGERSAASVEMSALWDELVPVDGAGSGVGAAAVSAALNKRRRSGRNWGLSIGGLGPRTAVMAAVLLLVVPLAIPLSAWFRSVSSTGAS